MPTPKASASTWCASLPHLQPTRRTRHITGETSHGRRDIQLAQVKEGSNHLCGGGRPRNDTGPGEEEPGADRLRVRKGRMRLLRGGSAVAGQTVDGRAPDGKGKAHAHDR